MRKLMANNSGATVIIAVGLSFLIMVFAFSMATVVRNSSNDVKRFKEQAQAQMSAESVEEVLMLLDKRHEAGFTVIGEDCEDAIKTILDIDDNFIDIECELVGRDTKTGRSDYIVPLFGTGTAGENCSITNPSTDLEDACNWNKLTVGSSRYARASIPLYYALADDDGTCGEDNICGPSDMNLYDFEIQVRTPCEEYDVDGLCTRRYEIAVVDDNVDGSIGYLSVKEDPTLVVPGE